MSSRNASRLDPGLIARKGEAAPAGLPQTPGADRPAATAAHPAAPEASSLPSGAHPPELNGPGPARGLHGTIAVTVRLDPRRYERLKVYGARFRRTNQEILVEALDRYFRDIKE